MTPALKGILQQLSDIHTRRTVASQELPLILQALNMIAEQLDGKQDAGGPTGTAKEIK